jgi:hypothetical protein
VTSMTSPSAEPTVERAVMSVTLPSAEPTAHRAAMSVTLPSGSPSASQNNNSSAAPHQRGLPDHDDVSDGRINPSSLVALLQEELEAKELEVVCCFTCGKLSMNGWSTG